MSFFRHEIFNFPLLTSVTVNFYICNLTLKHIPAEDLVIATHAVWSMGRGEWNWDMAVGEMYERMIKVCLWSPLKGGEETECFQIQSDLWALLVDSLSLYIQQWKRSGLSSETALWGLENMWCTLQHSMACSVCGIEAQTREMCIKCLENWPPPHTHMYMCKKMWIKSLLLCNFNYFCFICDMEIKRYKDTWLYFSSSNQFRFHVICFVEVRGTCPWSWRHMQALRCGQRVGSPVW